MELDTPEGEEPYGGLHHGLGHAHQGGGEGGADGGAQELRERQDAAGHDQDEERHVEAAV